MKIPKNIVIQYNLSKDTPFRECKVNPLELLCPNRLDIAAKMEYLETKEKMPRIARNEYIEHIRAMTKGAFVESYSNKKDPNTFLDEFDKLFVNIKENGFDDKFAVPVDKNMQILDGAHRVAISIVLGMQVPVIIIPIVACDKYDSDFFKNQGVASNLIDKYVNKYISYSANALCINIWPSAKKHGEELDKLINDNFRIIYRKNIKLNENGALYYLIQIYKEYSWAQNCVDGFSEVYRKLVPCFSDFSPVRLLFVEKINDIELKKIKSDMRDIFELDKHSLHITDNVNETREICQIVLNDNSIRFINQANVLAYKNTFNQLKEAIEKSSVSEARIVYTGSIVLALYGIREAYDLDYFIDDNSDYDAHNSIVTQYPYPLDELLFDENNYFCFFGACFLTLEVIKEFKKKRNDAKDKEDLFLIESVMKDNYKDDIYIQLIRKKRRMIARVQGLIIRISHKTGSYEKLRSIYRKIKRLS